MCKERRGHLGHFLMLSRIKIVVFFFLVGNMMGGQANMQGQYNMQQGQQQSAYPNQQQVCELENKRNLF